MALGFKTVRGHSADTVADIRYSEHFRTGTLTETYFGGFAVRRHFLFAMPVLVGLCCISNPLLADEKHLLLGTWALEAPTLTTPNPPRGVTITLSEVGGGKFKMSVDIIDSQGKASHGEGVFTPDGTASPAKGSLDVDVVSMTMPSRKILVMGAGMAGQPSSTRVFSLTDDGKHMIETLIRHSANGTPITRVDTWDRK
jgi:hypothetical protein